MSGTEVHTDRVGKEQRKPVWLIAVVWLIQSFDRCPPATATPPGFQWRWALRSYFSQNLSVKGMQVSSSHHSHLMG